MALSTQVCGSFLIYNPTVRRSSVVLSIALVSSTLFAQAPTQQRDQKSIEQQFLAVPDPKQAEEYMRVLTAEPHMAGTPEDKKTADYVAGLFRQWGLETEIVPYKVWLNYPAEVSIEMTAPAGAVMHGPSREHVDGDPFQDDPRVTPAFNGYSPSGDAEAEVIYANYCRPEDFDKLKERKIEPRGRILICRYGENFRGVKAYMAQEVGAAGLIIYSDPIDDGYFRGDVYPKGPWRPDTGVQRGTIEYGFEYPGDPTTPGFASTLDLPDSKRVRPEDSPDMPKVPTLPLSYHDAAPILQNLGDPETPREWQGALPFTYHIGPGPARVKLHIKQDYGYRTIWNVIARVPGTRWPDEWVIAGNHRDAWVYGAVDPVSGTVAMLEAARGVASLLKTGWRPKRTIIFASWDAEEQGLVGSTEWLEQNEAALAKAVAYFNCDTGAAGPNFRASAVPSLRGFLRDIAKVVPSPKGGMLYEQWRGTHRINAPNTAMTDEPPVGNLGSGSDFTAFLDHSGVPATDIRSSGNYGVYHSVFDNFAWFKKFGDTNFLYSQEIARVMGLEVLRMSEADVLPFDYEVYAKEISNYLDAAQKKASAMLGDKAPKFDGASAAATRFAKAAAAANALRARTPANPQALNTALRATESALLLPEGLPRRPYFKHAIYAPADLRGYAASVIPGVNESIDRKDAAATERQLRALADVLNRAAETLESVKP
ncbi:MAG TPA: M28 family metallopeptidase [Terriglobales bacterium]